MQRGEIWWATLDELRGSEPGYRRPVAIVSSNEFNESNIGTVLVVIITSNINLSKAPGNFLISKKESRLSKKSVVNISQILTLDKSFLSEKVGQLSTRSMLDLNDGLKLVLSLQ